MPIPTLPTRGFWENQDEMQTAYEANNWRRYLKFDWIDVDQRLGGTMHSRFSVNADKIACSCISGNLFTFVQVLSTGVYWTCASCRRTYGPLATEHKAVQQIGIRRVPRSEALEILEKSGQYVPPTLRETKLTDHMQRLI